MPSSPKMLSSQQKRIAKRCAGFVIPGNPSQWVELGEDERIELFVALIHNLRENKNTGIADLIEQNPEQGYVILREKIKSMRRTIKSM